MEGAHLAMQDLNGLSNIGDMVSVTWPNIAIGGAECVSFSGLFAENRAADANDIDAIDYIYVDYSLDNGESWSKLLHFQGASFGPDGVNNGLFYPDLDFDGEGDVSERPLNDTAWSYSAVSQPLNGASVLSLRLTARVEAGDEDAGMDSFRLMAAGCPLVESRQRRRVLFEEGFEGLELQDTVDEGEHSLQGMMPLQLMARCSRRHCRLDAQPSCGMDCRPIASTGWRGHGVCWLELC